MKKTKTPSGPIEPMAPAGVLTVRDFDKNQWHLQGPETGSGASKIYDYSTSPGFPGDVTISVQFDQFPSATRIFFAADEGATENTDQNFWLEVVTTRKRTSTGLRQLENFFAFNEGEIIEPGLRLMRKYRRNPSAPVREALTSVRITAPTAPPK